MKIKIFNVRLIFCLILVGIAECIYATTDSIQIKQINFIQNSLITHSTDSTLFNISDEIFINSLANIGLEIDSITAGTLDKNNRIWIGSNNGLWVFDDMNFRGYSFKDGLFDKQILEIYCSDKNQILVATPSGPFAFIDNHFYVFVQLKNQNTFSISESPDSWLFMTDNGPRIFRKETGFFDNMYIKAFIILVILLLLSILIFLGIRYFKTHLEWKTNLIRVEQLALLAQMSPHFIFNSLNSVQRYIMANDKESAHTYLQKFASMMRKVLENSRQSSITLTEEIATLELYLQLESLRFDNGFDFDIVVQDDDIWQFEIPSMILQTFVENAIWHGLMRKEDRGKINLRFSKINKNCILCEIEDNGIGRKKAAEYKSKDLIKHKSKGTAIVQKRIELLNLKAKQKITCETFDLEEKNNQQTGTMVRLEIPVVLG